MQNEQWKQSLPYYIIYVISVDAFQFLRRKAHRNNIWINVYHNFVQEDNIQTMNIAAEH